MLLALGDRDATSLLGAAKAVAIGGATSSAQLSGSAAGAISSLATVGLGVEAPDVGTLATVGPAHLASALDDAERITTAIELLAVIALVDGSLDPARLDCVLDFAQGANCEADWLEDLSLSLEPDLGAVIADMGAKNLASVTDGRVDLGQVDDINHWLMPYDGSGQDPALAARYRSLEAAPPGSLGHAFWSFYDRHHFVFPGEPGAVNEIFGTPHDCTHVLSSYDTTPQGELLVSTFTSRMHPIFPMAGHVLPVIYSWHLGIEFNTLAGSYRGALDPAKFWVAWDRGRQASGDAFSADFDFWAHTEVGVSELRGDWRIGDLDPAHAASSQGAVAGVDYHPIA